MELARWIESTADRIRDELTLPVPATRHHPLQVRRVSLSAGFPAVRADGQDASSSAKPMFTLDLERPESLPMLREALVDLALTEGVHQVQRDKGLPLVEPLIPPWLRVGLAASLEPEMIAGNRRILELAGVMPPEEPVGQVFGWVAVPEGWNRQRALCGLVASWVMSVPGSLEKLVGRLAAGEPLDPEWIGRTIMGVETAVEMESRWRAWNARETRVVRDFGGISGQQLRQLRLIVNAHDAAGLRMASDPLERPAQAALRREAVEGIQRIRALTAGQAPELVEVGERYCRCFEGVVKGSWAPLRKWRRSRADAALDRLDSRTAAREAYVDQAERDWLATSRDGVRMRGETVTGLEKARIEAYVDEAERTGAE